MSNPTGVTSAKGWKKVVGEEVTLPSGNVALVKRPGMEKLFAAGVLPDELTKIAIENIDQAQAGGIPRDHLPAGGAKAPDIDPEMLKKFLEGEHAVEDIFSSFDKITEMCVLQPPVKWHMRKKTDATGHWVRDDKQRPQYEEIPHNERDEDVLYTDDVDIEDKTFIFNFVVGGTRDLETFRTEYGDALADVQPSQDVDLPPI